MTWRSTHEPNSHFIDKMNRRLLFLTLPFFALDQFTKWLVEQWIAPGEAITVIPNGFYLVQVHNTGAAFGMLANNNLLFIALSLVVLISLVILWRRGNFRNPWASSGVALLLAGILGNAASRITHGYVIDFLLIDLHIAPANPWPAFNIADSCICIAAGIFVIRSLFDDWGRRARPESLPST